VNYLDMLAALGVSGAHPGGIEATKRLLAGRRLPAGARILEAGCGTGETACYLAAHGYRVTGLDRHPQMLAKARERAKTTGAGVEWVEGDIAAMPFPPASFDVVLAESATIFAPVARALGEYRRVLKPGGLVLDTEIALIGSMSRELRGRIASFLGVSRLLTERDWRLAFREAGFRLEHPSPPRPLFDEQSADASAVQDADMRLLFDPSVMAGIVRYHELIVANRDRFAACQFAGRKAGRRASA